jgi:hypothetical protein
MSIHFPNKKNIQIQNTTKHQTNFPSSAGPGRAARNCQQSKPGYAIRISMTPDDSELLHLQLVLVTANRE